MTIVSDDSDSSVYSVHFHFASVTGGCYFIDASLKCLNGLVPRTWHFYVPVEKKADGKKWKRGDLLLHFTTIQLPALFLSLVIVCLTSSVAKEQRRYCSAQ